MFDIIHAAGLGLDPFLHTSTDAVTRFLLFMINFFLKLHFELANLLHSNRPGEAKHPAHLLS